MKKKVNLYWVARNLFPKVIAVKKFTSKRNMRLSSNSERSEECIEITIPTVSSISSSLASQAKRSEPMNTQTPYNLLLQQNHFFSL